MVIDKLLSTWITPHEAAVILRCTPANVVRLANVGELRFHRTKLGRLIDPESVEELRIQRECNRTRTDI
jgi:excisionase family DNA binding protein